MCTLSVTAYGAIQEEDIDLGLVHASSLLQKQEGPGVTARVFSLYFRLLFAYAHSMPRQDDRHRVYMSFQCRYGWHCQFLEQDLKTPLPRKLHFASGS
jgi:hypothetical protein